MVGKKDRKPSKRSRCLPGPIDSPVHSVSGESQSDKLRFSEIKKLRQFDPYLTSQAMTAGSKFWNESQERLFNQWYSKLEVFEHRYVEWSDIVNPDVCDFDVSIKYEKLNLKGLVSFNESWVWNEELVRQFYATAYIKPDRSKMEFMIGNKRYRATKENLEDALSITPVAGSIILHTARCLDDNGSLSIGSGSNTKKGRRGFKPEVALIVRINEHTLFPRKGNRGGCTTINRKLAHAIYQQKHFDIAHFLLSEMCEVMETPNHALPYAPHIICLLRHLKLIPKDSALTLKLQKYTPQLPKRGAHEQDADQFDVFVSNMSQLIAAEVAKLDEKLSAEVTKLNEKVDKGFEAMDARLLHLSKEFEELRATVVKTDDGNEVRHVYKRNWLRKAHAGGPCTSGQ